MKRKAAPRPTRKPRRKPRAAPPQAPRDADPLAGSALRPLLERYCKLAGVKQAALGPDHVELKLPPAERPFFRDRERVSVAFSLDALERDPEAEIAVLGSPFVSQVVEAIRARGAHLSLGLIASASSASSPLSRRERGTGGEDLRERGDEAVELPIPVRDGVAKPGATRLAVHPVGRLAARVVLRAGAGVEEAVVETDVYDLSAGAPAGADVAAAFRELEAGRLAPADPAAITAAPVLAREPGELLQLLVSHLRAGAAERVATRRAAAEQELAAELGRLDRYFESVLKEQADAEALATVSALAERRRAEEIRRSQVKAVVHPLQLVEAAVLMQRAEWQLESEQGRRATFVAQRSFSGSSGWSLACPHCGRPPATLVICRHDHCGCEACSHRCSVCGEDFCADTGPPSAGLTACRRATSTCRCARPAGWSTAPLTPACAPKTATRRARRVSRPAAAAAERSATGMRSTARPTPRRGAAACARRVSGTARAEPTSPWAWTKWRRAQPAASRCARRIRRCAPWMGRCTAHPICGGSTGRGAWCARGTGAPAPRRRRRCSRPTSWRRAPSAAGGYASCTASRARIAAAACATPSSTPSHVAASRACSSRR